jgi:hypothetical protein
MENFFVGYLAVLQVLGIFLVLPIVIASSIISFVLIFGIVKRKVTGSIKESIEVLVCSIDADCPEGYLCVGGKCVPQA